MAEDLKDFTREELKCIIEKFGEKPFRTDQIFDWLFCKEVSNIDEMKNLPQPLKDKLKKQYCIGSLEALDKQTSKIDKTTKFLFGLEDGNKIESVIMYDKDRASLCVSSQVGCSCGCIFCATGQIGFKRNLTSGEIISQFITAKKEAVKLDGIVFMGMGEPLLNWDNVKKSIIILSDRKGYNYSQTRITVSTAGIVPVIKEIAENNFKFGLAISLIAADNDLRTKIMPLNKKYPLEEIVKASRYYNEKTGEGITFEYVLFNGLNDSPHEAKKLIALLRGIDYKINLIPYNDAETCCGVSLRLKKPDKERVLSFQKVLTTAGVKAFIRKEKGADIFGACGQLAGGYKVDKC